MRTPRWRVRAATWAAVAMLAAAGCCRWGYRFVDCGQEAPSYDVEDLQAKNRLKEVLQSRLNALHSLRAYGVDMTYESPEESHNVDLALYLRPPDRARAIISKGIIGVLAEVLIEGDRVTFYLPRENRAKVVHLRPDDFDRMRIVASPAIWGLYPEGNGPVLGRDVKPLLTEDGVILTLPFRWARGGRERLTFDRETLLLRSRVILPPEGAPLARAEYSRWRRYGEIWWPCRTHLRLPRKDIVCDLTFSRRPERTRPNAHVPDEVFTLDLPEDVTIEHEWYPEL